RADRLSLGWWRCRCHGQACCGIGRARARRHFIGHQRQRSGTATDHPSHTDRVVQVIDPVSAGFVESLARPGGNATGFTVFEYGISGKWLELLKEIAPSTTRAAVIRDPATAAQLGQVGAIQSVAPSLGIELRPIDAREAGEIERAVTTFARSGNGGAARRWLIAR